jgi:hypothetical protein
MRCRLTEKYISFAYWRGRAAGAGRGGSGRRRDESDSETATTGQSRGGVACSDDCGSECLAPAPLGKLVAQATKPPDRALRRQLWTMVPDTGALAPL